jgi:hypothetical protein
VPHNLRGSVCVIRRDIAALPDPAWIPTYLHFTRDQNNGRDVKMKGARPKLGLRAMLALPGLCSINKAHKH